MLLEIHFEKYFKNAPLKTIQNINFPKIHFASIESLLQLMLRTCVCIWICVLLAFRLCHQNPRDAMLGHLYQSNPLTRHHHHPTSILGQRCPFLRSTHLWPHHLVQNVLFNLSVVCLFWLLVPPGENISCPGGKENNKSGQIQFSRLNVSTIQTAQEVLGCRQYEWK